MADIVFEDAPPADPEVDLVVMLVPPPPPPIFDVVVVPGVLEVDEPDAVEVDGRSFVAALLLDPPCNSILVAAPPTDFSAVDGIWPVAPLALSDRLALTAPVIAPEP